MAFEQRIVAKAQDVDELGHVNNAVWVRWIQDIATAHWRHAAPAAYVDSCLWVVVRHEVDYWRALGPGGRVTARTWVANPPRGARFDRIVEFTGEDGALHVRARTTWAMLDKASGRPMRVPADLAAAFLRETEPMLRS